jgi:hypothetical protein
MIKVGLYKIHELSDKNWGFHMHVCIKKNLCVSGNPTHPFFASTLILFWTMWGIMSFFKGNLDFSDVNTYIN